jgi:hypothetical protein
VSWQTVDTLEGTVSVLAHAEPVLLTSQRFWRVAAQEGEYAE